MRWPESLKVTQLLVGGEAESQRVSTAEGFSRLLHTWGTRAVGGDRHCLSTAQAAGPTDPRSLGT